MNMIATMAAPKDIQDQLKQAIADCGMTRQELADKADISKGVLDKFMTIEGKSLNLDTAVKIARALGMKSLPL